jgi:hypothetical protein
MFAPRTAKPNAKSTESQSSDSVVRHPIHSALDHVHLLQRSIGNQAVLRLLRQADHPLELEADRLAGQVMRMPALGGSIAAAPPQFSRNSVACKREQPLEQKPAATTEVAGETPAIVNEVLRSPGQPLDSSTRAYFEPRFGRDFSHVRVHTESLASQSAEAVAARAYTLGSDIAFRHGEYAPGTHAGRYLLAHELAHTVQQRIAPATAGIFRKPIPGWNFTPYDYLNFRSGRALTIAPDSSFFPSNLQENLLRTLAFVLGPAIMPPATEGINALDFFHGHLVIKKDPATAMQAAAEEKKAGKFQKELKAERTKAFGHEVSFGTGYPLTEKNIPAYQKAVEKVLPSFGTLLDGASKAPGAAVMYHTFEFNQPRDLQAKGQKLASEDPRRHYVTPLDTNRPVQYTPPSGGTYEKEYTHITSFVFLVDDKGAVHVRPFDASTAFTTLELSTITGTTYPEPVEGQP